MRRRNGSTGYDVLMILTVIVIYSSMSGLLRHAGLSEGT